jgi:putative pyruvate formate lyase activating enzyme
VTRKENIILCNDCPRNCNASRQKGSSGYCNTADTFQLGSICIHRGEEPVLGGEKGIVNVFFSHCNLQCIYCQNIQISKNDETSVDYNFSLNEIISIICEHLDKGINYLGFVSPSHSLKQLIQIIKALHKTGRKPIIVFNSNGYDKVESLKQLDGLVDIYLPDFKYADDKLAYEYSDAANYKKTALAAVKEMYRQKGSVLHQDIDGHAESGLIIRHLVLPDAVENSKAVLKLIAEEISVNIHISLMSQYYPTENVIHHQHLNRSLLKEEYEAVINEMESLGFSRGWVQDIESTRLYRPDFGKEHPFE